MEYEKQELLNKEIIIRGLYISGGVSEKTKKVWAKIKVTDQHDDKYSVWKTKQDGEITKAFAKMMEHSWFFNVAVGITYSEADKEFTDRNGKLVKYKERNIIGFSALNSHRPETEEHEEIERQIEEVSNEEIEEINTEEIPF